MTRISARTEPDVSLFGLAGWFLFLWVVSQVFPAAWRAPWSFGGWFSPVLSVASWFVGGLATVAIVMMFVNQKRKPLFTMPLELFWVMAGWGLVFVAMIAFLHFVSTQGIGAPVAMADDPLKSRIENLRERQGKLGAWISDLEAERSAVVGRIRRGSAQVIHAHELLEIDRSLKELKGAADEVALTITKGEALLRQTERQRRLCDAALDSNELDDLRVEIEERLQASGEPRSAGEPVQLEKVVREAVWANP